MSCPGCGEDFPAGARHCPACGFSPGDTVAGGCRVCGAPALDSARFCWACGGALTAREVTLPPFESAGPPKPPPELARSLQRFLPAQVLERLTSARGPLGGERRVVTILFADVKGSTAMADRMDPEEVLEIMNGAFHVLIEPITREGGTIARLMGDAVLAFFGAPVAHEDDPARAARAALEIVKGARAYGERLERERGVTGFDVRVGMNTGLVVLAEVGDGDRVEYTAMGDAVNLASRMETAAPPGTILMTEATRRLLGPRFVTASVGALEIRGKPRPVLTHRLLSGNDGEPHASPTHLAPLSGRSPELARIRRVLDRTRDGKGAVIVLSGEPGVGKTRLVHEARKPGFRSWHWADVRSGGGDGKVGNGAARSILMGLSAQPEGGGAWQGLKEQLDKLDPAASLHLHPYLALALGCAEEEVAGRLRHLEPAVLRPRIAQAVGQYVRTLASTGPVGIFWDDFHAVDEPSAMLLESLVPLAVDAPVVFLLVCRREEGHAAAAIRRIREQLKGRVSLLRVGPLPRRAVVALLDALLGRRKLAPTLRQDVLAKTQGNALFLEEVVRQLLDKPTYRSSRPGRSGTLAQGVEIPDTLRAMVMSRLDSLPGPEREALQAASVLEGPFDGLLIGSILGGQAASPPVDTLLEELRRKGILAARQAGGAAVFGFCHSMTRQVLGETMLHTQRTALHRRAAGAMEGVFAGQLDEHAKEIALHYEMAGLPARAVEFLVRAARHAGSVAAAQSVAELCRRGLDLSSRGTVLPEAVRELHERLADALAVLARYPEAIDHYGHASSSDASPLAQAALARKRAGVLEKLGRYDEAVTEFERALVLLKPALDLPEATRIFLGLAQVYCRRGDCPTAIDMSLVALELANQEGDEWGVALASNTLGVVHTKAGDLPAALEALHRAEEILRKNNERYDLSATLTNLGWSSHRMGNDEEAAKHLRESIGLCESTGNRHGLATASDLLSQVLMAQGEHREADRYLRKAVRIFAAGGDDSLLPQLWGQTGAW